MVATVSPVMRIDATTARQAPRPTAAKASSETSRASTAMTTPRANQVSTVIMLWGAMENNSWKARSSIF